MQAALPTPAANVPASQSAHSVEEEAYLPSTHARQPRCPVSGWISPAGQSRQTVPLPLEEYVPAGHGLFVGCEVGCEVGREVGCCDGGATQALAPVVGKLVLPAAQSRQLTCPERGLYLPLEQDVQPPADASLPLVEEVPTLHAPHTCNSNRVTAPPKYTVDGSRAMPLMRPFSVQPEQGASNAVPVIVKMTELAQSNVMLPKFLHWLKEYCPIFAN